MEALEILPNVKGGVVSRAQNEATVVPANAINHVVMPVLQFGDQGERGGGPVPDGDAVVEGPADQHVLRQGQAKDGP